MSAANYFVKNYNIRQVLDLMCYETQFPHTLTSTQKITRMYRYPFANQKDASSEEKSSWLLMKTEAASKTISTTFTCTDKSYCPCSTSANPQHSSSKPLKCSNKEWGTTWTPHSSSTHADHTQPLQASTLSTMTRTWAMMLSDTTQADKWLGLQLKEPTFIILIFHTTVAFGTSAHPWNTMMRSTPRISSNNELYDNHPIPIFDVFLTLVHKIIVKQIK